MRKLIKPLSLILLVPVLLSTTVFATNPSSSNYSVDQVFFGAGGSINESSPNYQARATVGETGIGNYNSPDYQAYAGFNTTSSPYIQLVVTATNLNLGTLSTSSTATAQSTFYVRAWNSAGYVVQTDSPTPYNGSHYINNLSTPTSSSAGTEQFGMNLVANSSPINFGSNPDQTTSYAVGQAAANYAIANKYTYNNGDTIAYSTKSTSATIYTIAYIFNISNGTSDGQYTFDQSLVATGDY